MSALGVSVFFPSSALVLVGGCGLGSLVCIYFLEYGDKSFGARRQSDSFVSSDESAEFITGYGCYDYSNNHPNLDNPNSNSYDYDDCRTDVWSSRWGR